MLDAYEDFKQLLQKGDPPSKKDRGGTPDASSKGNAAPSPAVVKTPTSLPLKPYLARLKLRGNKEKATAIIAWSGESGQNAELTVSEIEQLWKKTPFKAPKNLARDVRKAETEGWLDSQGKPGSSDTTYRINGYGEGIIAGWVEESKE